jgi:hypothetical protein
MSSRYSRLQTFEPKESATDAKKVQAERVERIQAKVHAFFWVALAIGAIYYVDFLNVAMHNETVRRGALNASVVCLACNICLICYLVIYLPIFEKIKDHKMWDIHCPNVIPIITVLGLTAIVLLNVAFWPVWGLLTPLLIFFLTMGFLLVGHFIPSCW